jgi:hypothetical protein
MEEFVAYFAGQWCVESGHATDEYYTVVLLTFETVQFCVI